MLSTFDKGKFFSALLIIELECYMYDAIWVLFQIHFNQEEAGYIFHKQHAHSHGYQFVKKINKKVKITANSIGI